MILKRDRFVSYLGHVEECRASEEACHGVMSETGETPQQGKKQLLDLWNYSSVKVGVY